MIFRISATPIRCSRRGRLALVFADVSSDTTVPRYFVTALFTSGQTGIVQGVEHGVAEQVEFIGRQPKRHFSDEPKYKPFITKVNSLIQQYRTFNNSGNIRFVDREHDTILAALRFGRQFGENDFLLLANLDVKHEQTIELDLAQLGLDSTPNRLQDLLSGQSIDVNETHLLITMGPCGVRAFELT